MMHYPDIRKPTDSTPMAGIFLGAAVAFLVLCAAFWPFVADDAFIVGRYALNAANGHGLVYNIGERVSALTSPLHALIESAVAIFTSDPVHVYRLAAPLVVLAGWLVAIRHTGLRGHALWTFTLLSLFSPFLILWTVGGLETPLLTCLATIFVARLTVIVRRGRAFDADFLWLGALAAAMFLTRHDSAVVTAPILLAITFAEYRRPSLWRAAILAAVIAGSWLAFAAIYYGDIFPTSFYLKLALGGRAPIDSISALVNFVALSGLLVAALAVRLPRIAERPAISRAILRGGAVATILFLVYASRASGQHMMFGYRLFVPWLMPAALVLSQAIARPRAAMTTVFAIWQIVMLGVVYFIGVNPAPLRALPGLNHAFAEYEYIRPRMFLEWSEMLKHQAADITQHWEDLNRTETPKIYLRSGGMGYWLPDFYVFETLVSYRHDCGEPARAMIRASHYAQQLGFSMTGTMVEQIARERADIPDDAPLLFATTIEWMGRPEVTGYLFGPEPVEISLGDTVNAKCVLNDAARQIAETE
ncbi:hypothetical protein LV82_02539 [Albidovulum inexpectatum]|uniref:Dolichyl-phosphate-mannose-protein mannosyltransferase n=1 Tax=Albidovulum inexpectatum TaxID=196587 RepID=A0A2S5JED8_9RHOB|nr:hypothetical protein [Albidovulum inexpectatum]PPB79748.1 hypothetical protein LV82_02539 [Albidovulum inexpectatum]